ncbi:hypothetical protein MJ565_20120 [Klebsiella pneumoniae]|nr:hypothetical protein MJ565_20120 [Klebsiella pneumoniae]
MGADVLQPQAAPDRFPSRFRFVYQHDMPDAMVEMLRDKLSISNYDSMLPGGYAITTLKRLYRLPERR